MTELRRLRAALLLAATLVAAVVLAGCGSKQAATGGADPAAWAPAGAPLYVEATIRPGEPLRGAVDSVVRKVSLTPDWRAKLVHALDRSSSTGITYSKDIDPWLGSRLGVFLAGSAGGGRPAYAAIVDVRDEDKLKAELNDRLKVGGSPREGTYRDTKYRLRGNTASGVVKGSLVVGSEEGFRKVVDVSKGAPALAGDDAFNRAKTQVTSQRVALFYVDLPRIFDLVPQGAGGARSAQLEQVRRLYGLLGVKPFASALTATPSSIAIETAVSRPTRAPGGRATGRGTPLFAQLPGDSWVAVGAGDFGGQVKRGLASLTQLGAPGVSLEQIRAIVQAKTGLDLQRDLLGWMGDVAFFVHGTSRASLGGGAIIASRDPAASQRAVPRIGRALAQLAHRKVGAVTVAGGHGFSIPTRRGAQPVLVVARGDRVVIGYGAASVRDALAPSHRLGDSPELRTATDALGSGLTPGLYVSAGPIVALARSLGAGSSAGFARALPYLNAYRFLITGSRREGDLTHSRLIVGLR
ncbi:MAG: hypothetical protein QOK31_1502 [Solirubrobacteraceae bacterium]|jgi:hypothetical protein|nr:hypothetical protein [Solirubrobacteraceae bacterium]